MMPIETMGSTWRSCHIAKHFVCPEYFPELSTEDGWQQMNDREQRRQKRTEQLESMEDGDSHSLGTIGNKKPLNDHKQITNTIVSHFMLWSLVAGC